jgi:hypothetical protein
MAITSEAWRIYGRYQSLLAGPDERSKGGVEVNIEMVEEGVTTYSNAIFGNVETKSKVAEGMLRLIALSCQQYHKDEVFRRQIDSIERVLRPTGR